MRHKKIAGLLIFATIIATGCSQLTMGVSTDPSASVPAAQTSQTAPATVPVTIPETRPKSEAELFLEQWTGRIYPGIQISGFKVGGLSYEEAEAKLKAGHDAMLQRKLVFRDGVEKITVTQAELGITYDYMTALEKAKSYCNNLSAESQKKIIEEATDLALTAELKMDETKLQELADRIGEEVDREVTKVRYGQKLKKDEFIDLIKEKVAFSLKDAAEQDLPLEILSLELAKEDQATISKGYTWFSEGNVNRSYNVRLAAKKVNGTVVMPGEIFSFNDTVGAASKKNGFKAATVYAGEGMQEGYGGGVCQVSSTLYNAIIRAGLPLVERHTHGYIISYLPKGMDATIYYPGLDLKFLNTLAYPITIRATAEDGDLTFRFISHKDALGGLSYKFSQDVLWVGDKSWNIKYTTELKPGEEEIIYYPLAGSEVNVYRSTYKDGKQIKRELFDNVRYRELKGSKLVGKE